MVGENLMTLIIMQRWRFSMGTQLNMGSVQSAVQVQEKMKARGTLPPLGFAIATDFLYFRAISDGCRRSLLLLQHTFDSERSQRKGLLRAQTDGPVAQVMQLLQSWLQIFEQKFVDGVGEEDRLHVPSKSKRQCKY